MAKETHGEKWYRLKTHQSTCWGLGLEVSYIKLPNRMGYQQAIDYYKVKFKKYFSEQLTVNDFDSVEDFYDFHAANKILFKL